MPTELYFSEVTLDFGDYESHPTFGSTRTYLEHQVACDLFGQYDDRPFLFRSDFSQGASGTLLVLSTVEPSAPRTDAATYGFMRRLRTARFPTDLSNRTRLDFEVRLNATKDVPIAPGKRSKRVDIWEHARRQNPVTSSRDGVYAEYLKERLAPAATVQRAHVTERSFIKIGKKDSGKGAIRFVATNVIGTLVIEDATAFVSLLKSGIGRSRGFGCGLLCLSKPGSVLPRRYPREASRAMP